MAEPSGLPALSVKSLKALGPLSRTFDVSVDGELLAGRSQGDDRIPLVISTETPAYQSALNAMEVLDHSDASVDLSRLSRGIPLMAVMRGLGQGGVGGNTHGENTVQVGVVSEPSLGADRKLRAWARFGRSAIAQEVRQDVEDGIRQYVSPGYRITRMRRERAEDGTDLYRATRWMPFEVTFVPAPADMEAGVGRSADGDARPVEVEDPEPNTAPQAEEHAMAENANAAPANNGAAQVQERDGTMQNLAELARANDLSDVFSRGVSEGRSPQEIRDAMITEQKRRLDAGRTAIQNNGASGVVQLTEREEKEYSFGRAVLAAAGEADNSFEMEVSQTIARSMGPFSQASKRGDGGGQGSLSFWFPTNVRMHLPAGANPLSMSYGQRAGLYNAATVGAEVVFDVPGSFIDLLRKRARVLQAGATFLGGLTSPVTFPKQVAAGTAYWMPENGGTDVTDSNLVLSTVTLTPKTLQSSSSFSRQLLKQASFDTENMVRSDLAAIHALAIDYAGLNGPGTLSPTGIIPDTNCNTVVLGTHGAAPDYTSIVKMEEEVEKDDADNTGSAAYITTPSVKRKLKTTQDFTSNGNPIWTGGIVGQMNGYTAYSTNQVPSNLTKGTSTTVCHAIVFGHWANLLIGDWGAMEIIVDPFRLKKQGMIELTSFQMADVAKRYAQSFCVISDALPG